MSRRNTRKGKSEQSQTKRDNSSRGEYAVKYPQEYVSHATHPIVTSARTRVGIKGSTISARYAVTLGICAITPVDKDDEMMDTAVNNYRLIKSLTAGARYYTETTVLSYMYNLRALVLIAHEYAGRLKALRTLDRVGDPSLYAYRSRTPYASLNEQTDSTLIGELPKFESIFLEMVSDLNAIPVFESVEYGFMKDLFLYAFLDESHPGGDLYSPSLYSVQYTNYDDQSKTISAMSSAKRTAAMNFDQLYELFAEIRETFNGSLDLSNLSADILGVLPSSRKDWMGHFDISSPYVVALPKKMATIFASADIVGTVHPGDDVSEDGRRIIPAHPTIPSWSTASDSQGRLLSCDLDELELSSMMLTYHSDGEEVYSTGYMLQNIFWLHFPEAGKGSRTLFDAEMAKTVSTIQSTAEEGFKKIAAIWARYNNLPKVFFDDYGESVNWANVLWSPLGIREVPMVDYANGIKVLNSINHKCINTAIRDR